MAMQNMITPGRIGKAVLLPVNQPSRQATGSGPADDPMNGKQPAKKMAVYGPFGVKAPGCGGSGSC
jgi:hypothetical protein